MKDYAVIVTFEDGSKKVNGYYKTMAYAVRMAKSLNKCKYLHNKYSVMQVSTGQIIELK